MAPIIGSLRIKFESPIIMIILQVCGMGLLWLIESSIKDTLQLSR